MITSVHFKYFRALRDVSMTLTPLTVLVGPNSSGKTSAMEGLNPKVSTTVAL
ncbi:AAA family ATPase [Stigmatella erecta]|uniref:AAA family ATPase n=1 Tax=Stigmatella erecta TaxID=83460 RepID=UPI000B8050EE